MLHPRIIPCLLIKDKGLVKTVQFGSPKYVGDPINAVRIFNEKGVDELMVVDIDASTQKYAPDYKMIENLAAECRMPLCYGGGIKTADQALQIFSLGVEKIALSSAAIESPKLLAEIAQRVGNQSVILVLDVKRKLIGGAYEVYTCNGKVKTGIDPFKFIAEAEQQGVGEIVINSIDRDGTMKGYDENLISKVRATATVPITVLGGAGSLDDVGQIMQRYGTVGVAAGSLFVFKGKYRAVLINYPNRVEKESLISAYFGAKQ